MTDQISNIQPSLDPFLDETDSPETGFPFAIFPMSEAPLLGNEFASWQETFDLLVGRSSPNGDRENAQISHGPERFDSLPTEVLIEIFERVDLRDLCSLQLVSRKIHRITHTALHGQSETESQLTETAYEYFSTSHTPAETALPKSLGGELCMVGEYGLLHAIAHSRYISLPLTPLFPVDENPLQLGKLDKVLAMLKEHAGHIQFLGLEACNMPKTAPKILSALSCFNIEKEVRPVTIKIDLGIDEDATDFEDMQAEVQAHVGEIVDGLTALLQSDVEIKVLCLSNLSVGPGISMLGPALEKNGKVRDLELDYNNVGPEGAQWLGRMMERHHVLERLSLNDNEIGAAGAKYLASALKSDSVLTELYISHNEISDDGIDAIATALLDNPLSRLKLLELNGNHIGNLGMTSFALLLERSNVLTTLALGSNEPDPALATDSVGMLLNAVKNNVTLNHLVLGGLFMDNADAGQWMAEELALMLAENTTLKILIAAFNSMDEDALIQLIDSIPTDTGLTYLNLTGNLGHGQKPGEDLQAALQRTMERIPKLHIEIVDETPSDR